jgi:ubiquinone/menaquinone biosynthesis C-methylase UbiE
MSKTKFDVHAEQDYYQVDSEAAATQEYLSQLNDDMKLWVPDMDSIFHNKVILDIGAGKAPVGTVIAQTYKPAMVVSLELVLHRLLAGKPWKDRLPSLKLVGGNVFTLPFPSRSFDIVIANSVLHHLPDLPQMTLEIARILKPGGLYIGREPNFNNPVVRWAVFRFPGTPFFQGSHSPNEYPLRAQEVERAFQQAGFQCDLLYFWRRLSWLRHPYLSVAISVRARRLAQP